MTQFVIYRKPAVDDKYYDEHVWSQDKTPFDSETKARDNIPSVGSEVGEGYVFRLAEFSEDEEIPTTLDNSEMQKRS